MANESNNHPEKEDVSDHVVLPDTDDILLAWEADEFLHHDRTVVWYIMALIGIVLLIFYAIVTAAWSMAIAVALMGGVLYLYSHEAPTTRPIIITKLGVHFGHKYYSYHQLKSFWFINEPNYQALVLEVADKLNSQLMIQLHGQDMSEIRDVLLKELPEDEGKEESLIDRFGRFLKI